MAAREEVGQVGLTRNHYMMSGNKKLVDEFTLLYLRTAMSRKRQTAVYGPHIIRILSPLLR